MTDKYAPFIGHEACPECGSKDNVGVYANGYKKCFGMGCDYWQPPDGEWRGQPRPALDNIEWVQGEFKAVKGRKLTEATCRKYGYHVVSGKCGVFNYTNADGQLCAQHLRYPNKNMPWVGDKSQALLFGQQLFKPGQRAIYITEGEYDAMSLHQALDSSWPVVSISSGAAGAKRECLKHFEFLNSFEQVYIAFDADDPGQTAAVDVAQLFPPGKARIFTWPPGCKDSSDVLVKLGPAALSKLRWEAQPYRPDGIVSGADLSIESLRATRDSIPGFDISYPKLNSMIHGVRKGTIFMLTAGTGIGKTTAADEFGYQLLMDHGLKVTKVALEETVNVSALTYMARYLEVPRCELIDNPDIVTPERYQEAYDKTVNNGRWWTYDHFGSLESDNLLAKIEYLATAGMDFVILDHISIMVSGQESHSREGERKDIDIFMTKLRSLVARTGLGVIAIVHLRKAQGGGKGYTEGKQVSLEDLRGSGSLAQISDTIVALERNQQGDDPTIAQVRVLKNRWFSVTGPADTLRYNLTTGILSVCEDDYFPSEDESPNGDF